MDFERTFNSLFSYLRAVAIIGGAVVIAGLVTLGWVIGKFF